MDSATEPRREAPEEASVTMQIAFPDHAEKNYTKLAFCAALYLMLIVIWMPGFPASSPVYEAPEGKKPMSRKVLRPPPEKPIEPVQRKTEKSKKVPMPDTTPREPEPFVAASVPDTVAVVMHEGDWEIGIPEGPPVPDPGEGVAAVGDAGVDPPVFIKKVPPSYPEAGVKVRLQGYVILQAILRKTGVVEEIKVLRGLGRGKFGFEEEAIASLRKWEFLPGKVNGEPADVRMNLRVDFIIN